MARTGHDRRTPSGWNQLFDNQLLISGIPNLENMFYGFPCGYCSEIMGFRIECNGRLGMRDGGGKKQEYQQHYLSHGDILHNLLKKYMLSLVSCFQV